MATCSVCGKRPPKRFCPALGEKICAVCCGQGRETTIDCVPSCDYLIAAHHYEAEHRQPKPAEEFPYRELPISSDFVYAHWPVVTGLAHTILGFEMQERDFHDGDALQALEALAETYRTLGTGIYYEHPPDAAGPRQLYGRLAEFLTEFRKNQASRGGPNVKDSEIFQLLVFLLRVGKQETNGRPKSRSFLGFLAARFPLPVESLQEPPRIIVP